MSSNSLSLRDVFSKLPKLERARFFTACCSSINLSDVKDDLPSGNTFEEIYSKDFSKSFYLLNYASTTGIKTSLCSVHRITDSWMEFSTYAIGTNYGESIKITLNREEFLDTWCLVQEIDLKMAFYRKHCLDLSTQQAHLPQHVDTDFKSAGLSSLLVHVTNDGQSWIEQEVEWLYSGGNSISVRTFPNLKQFKLDLNYYKTYWFILNL